MHNVIRLVGRQSRVQRVLPKKRGRMGASVVVLPQRGGAKRLTKHAKRVDKTTLLQSFSNLNVAGIPANGRMLALENLPGTFP